MTAPPNVRIILGASPALALLLVAAHGVALIVMFIVTSSLLAQYLVGSVIVVSGAWTICHALQPEIEELEVGEGGHVSLRELSGSWHEARVLKSSFVAPWLTVLNLRMVRPRRYRHVVILPDSVAPEDFRRLRVLLRWAPPRSGAPADFPNNRG